MPRALISHTLWTLLCAVLCVFFFKNIFRQARFSGREPCTLVVTFAVFLWGRAEESVVLQSRLPQLQTVLLGLSTGRHTVHADQCTSDEPSRAREPGSFGCRVAQVCPPNPDVSVLVETALLEAEQSEHVLELGQGVRVSRNLALAEHGCLPRWVTTGL